MNISPSGMPIPEHPSQALSKPSGQTTNNLYFTSANQPVDSKKIGDRQGHQVSNKISASTRLQCQNKEMMAIANTVRERLGHMSEVVKYKRILDKDIFDKSRENVVLEKAESLAKNNGITTESFKAFIQANMNAARAIQHAQLKSGENKNPSERTDAERQAATDALKRIRDNLTMINERMAVQIGAFLKHHGPFKASMGDLLISHVGFEQLPDENKSELHDKLLAISAVTEK